MAFKEGQSVELKMIPPPPDANGKPAVVKGTITKLTKGHAIVRFDLISDGLQLAVKRSGDLVLLGAKDKLEKDCALLQAGDVEAIAFDDLNAREERKPMPEWITREVAEHWLGEYAASLNYFIENKTIDQSIEGLLRTSDVAYIRDSVPTLEANIKAEQLRGAQ